MHLLVRVEVPDSDDASNRILSDTGGRSETAVRAERHAPGDSNFPWKINGCPLIEGKQVWTVEVGAQQDLFPVGGCRNAVRIALGVVHDFRRRQVVALQMP